MNGHIIVRYALLALLALIVAGAPTPSTAADITTYPVTQTSFTQYNPQISGSTVVWCDYRDGNWDIYGMDLKTGLEFPICVRERTQDLPYIEGPIVLWRDIRNGNWDIYGYNLETGDEFPVCVDPSAQRWPAVYGSVAVWQDRRSGDWDIYARDLSTGDEWMVAGGPGNQEFPAICRGTVVWADNQGQGGDIVGKDLITSRQFVVADTSLDESRPVVYGDFVIWRTQTTPPYWNLFAKQLSTGETFSICTAAGDQWYANLCGDIVVWDDHRGVTWDIYGFDLKTRTGFTIAKALRDQLLPDIDGHTVVWHDTRDGSCNIWAADLSSRFVQDVEIGSEYLRPGSAWLSFPLQPLDPDPAAILGADVARNRLCRWEPRLKTIQTYPDDFTQVEPGIGYYLALDDLRFAAYTGIRANGDQVVPLRYWGCIWIGSPMIQDIELANCLVRDNETGEIRTSWQDRHAQDPWISWQFIYWDPIDRMAKITSTTSPADDTVLRPWYGYRVWVNRAGIDLILPATSQDTRGKRR